MSAPDAQRQLTSLPLAVIMIGPGQEVVRANPAAEQLLGQSLRRLAGRRIGSLLTFKDDLLGRRIDDPDGQLSAREAEVVIVGQPGTRRLDVSLAPVLEQPGWQVLTLNDISSAEAMREDAGGSDEGFLRAPEILAHEIKNPLAGIRGAAQLLGRKAKGGDLALTGLIADEVDRIAKLIDQMQSLSSRTPRPVEPCNLHEAIRRARAVMDASGKSPVIIEEFDPSLPLVLGNVDSLVQVLINLLANAAEACADARLPRILLRTRFASGLQLHTGPDGTPVRLPIELRVSDNGPGIDPALREHIFDPFVTSKTSGQGLGLALVRRLLRDMNGRISHDRDEAAGWTHFRIHLPLAQQRKSSSRSESR